MLKVLKFGGTSVGTLERIDNVASIIKKMKDNGDDVVAVVSAMSGETNKLIEYAEHFSSNPDERELDMLLSSGERVTSALLSIALNEAGYPTTSMSGREAGIYTTDEHTYARIEKIETDNMKEAIGQGKVIIVAGFQGVSLNEGRVTTLGRGGSDLTAVALAGALEADLCEIYTDVDGIYTTDPRIEPKAKKMEKISYDEMLELASLGAKVLQNRSVEMAKKLNVNLVSRSSFTPEVEGTLITKEENIMEAPLVSGIALDRNQVRIGMYGVEDKPGIASTIFTALGDAGINVDMIVQTVGLDNKTNLDFTIPTGDVNKAKEIMKRFEDNTDKIDFKDDICKVSVVGVGMKSHTNVASNAFKALAAENINIRIISTSEIKISMVIEEKYAELAVRALHAAYELEKVGNFLQEFTNWTVQTIREDRYIGSWLEEKKFEWIPIVGKTIQNVIDKGKSVLLVTDDEREWFMEYILSKINASSNNRPMLPVYDFYGMLNGTHHFHSDMDIELIRDMLDISYPNGYIFWYIGRSQSKKSVLPKVTSNSFLWLFDEDYQNSFNMKSSDETLDMKLMQLYRLFDKTLNATLFAEIEVDK